MRQDKDEITLREAAELLEPFVVRRPVRLDFEDDISKAKRAREVGNAGATLDVMLAASRRGKTVKGRNERP